MRRFLLLSSGLLPLQRIVSASEGSKWDNNWDLREPNTKDDNPNQKRISHQLILIRHGQYESGETDSARVLSERGRSQAVTTGERLQALQDAGRINPIKHIYYSTMTRATQTAQIMMANMEIDEKELPSHNIQPCSLIREGAVCKPSPTHPLWQPSDEEFRKDNLRVEAAFMNHVHRARVVSTLKNSEDGDDGDNDDDNDEEDEEDAVSESYSTVLVCHGNVIRYFVMRALQLPPEAWLRTSVANASITILNISHDGHVSLRGMGDCGHLEPKDVTYN